MKISYRYGLVFTMGLFLTTMVVIADTWVTTGDWVRKSIDLRGGTLVTIKVDGAVDAGAAERILQSRFPNVNVRMLNSFTGTSLLVQADAGANATGMVAALSDSGISVGSFSQETVGPALGSSFWQQAQLSIFFAFAFMAVVIYAIYRVFVPSFTIVFSGFANMAGAIAVMDMLGMQLSLAGLGALLMLIGYSVDTNVLLTTRALRATENVKDVIRGSMKTGLTMTCTTMVALGAILLLSPASVLTEIASVLLIGLFFDIPNTWVQNVAIIRWYLHA